MPVAQGKKRSRPEDQTLNEFLEFCSEYHRSFPHKVTVSLWRRGKCVAEHRVATFGEALDVLSAEGAVSMPIIERKKGYGLKLVAQL